MTEVTAALRNNLRSWGSLHSTRPFARALTVRSTLLSLGIGMCLLPGLASAVPITFTGSSSPLAASATFDISGNNLIITLTNTATYDNATDGNLASNQAVTGLFFDLTANPTLTPLSATIASGSLIQASTCGSPTGSAPCAPATTDVGGEFRFDTGDPSFPSTAFYGIASSGYITSGVLFGSTDLDPPVSPNGANFALVPSGFLADDGNGGLDNDPVIRNAVQFVLSDSLSGLSAADIVKNVSFQYGTSFTEPTLPGDPIRPPQSIPEPATLFLFGTGVLGLALTLRRKFIRE